MDKRIRSKSSLLEKHKNLRCHKEISLLKKSCLTSKGLKERQRNLIGRLLQTSVPEQDAVPDNLPSPDVPPNSLPVYHLKTLHIESPAPLPLDTSLSPEAQAKHAAKEELLKKKSQLVTLVSVALVSPPNLKLPDEVRPIQELVQFLADQDPEFILKAALYSRQELQVRQLTNFLLAFCSHNPRCRIYIRKYFSASIVLPSDWLEVTKQVQAYGSSQRSLYLPSSLRKALSYKFSDFDEYQLAKYNRDPAKAKKKREKKKEKQIKEKKIQRTSPSLTSRVTLKRMVQLLHLSDPPQYVMAILGRKYPQDEEMFRRARLPGSWNPDLAGSRMKLAVPETWETQISTAGNTARVWEKLIDRKKLPIMAALRNLRNLILSGVSQRHHAKVCRNLFTNLVALSRSRMLPSNFLSAYDALDSLSSLADSSPAVPGGPWWKVKMKRKMAAKRGRIKAPILSQYREALETGLNISVQYNLPRVPGWTLIILDSFSMLQGNFEAKVEKAACLLAILARCACEDSQLICSTWSGWQPWNPKPDSAFLSQVDQLRSFIKADSPAKLKEPGDYPKFLENLLHPSSPMQWDSVIHLAATPVDLNNFLLHYRATVNSNLVYVRVDVTASRTVDKPQLKHPKDIFLSGTSEKILRFLCERGTDGQVSYVERIDKLYKLRTMPQVAATQLPPSIIARETTSQSWRTIRVFISSPFRDMHGERDLLVRYIFPELKSRAAKLRINLYEVDLRWGLAEFQPQDSRSVEVCLAELAACQLFVGLLGERYGTCPPYPSSPEWLQSYPPGASLTELEMYAAALSNPRAATQTAFFYLRDPQFVRCVPEKFRDDFQTSDPDAKLRLDQLKESIRSSGLNVYDNYPCEWGGERGGLPMAVGLDSLAHRLLDDLWHAIKHLASSGPQGEVAPLQLHRDFAARCGADVVGRHQEISELRLNMEEMDGGVILVTGQPGSGKTSFLGYVAGHLPRMVVVVPYFVEASNTAATMEQLVETLYTTLCHKLGLSSPSVCSPSEFENILQHQIPEGVRVVLVVDGLEDLPDWGLQWLPLTFPKGLYVILSSSPEAALHDMVKVPCRTLTLQPLALSERQQLVSAHLARHGKALQVTTWNNQLRSLTTKMAAHLPLYLRLACNHLLTAGVFDSLSEQVKDLPSTLPNLLTFQLHQMEDRHGRQLTEFVLSVLLLSPRGVCKEAHLRQLAAEIFPSLNSPLLFSLLFSDLRQILSPHHLPSGRDKLVLSPVSDLAKVAGQRYLKSKAGQKALHARLAEYYAEKYKECQGHPSADIFRSYLHHIAESNPTPVPSVIQDPAFLQSCLEAGEGPALMSACRVLPGLADLQSFLSRNMDLLSRYPGLLVQQIRLECPPDSALHQSCASAVSGPMILQSNKTDHYNEARSCVARLTLPIQPVCLAVSSDHIAVGCQNGAILVLSQPDIQISQNLLGHTRPVTCLAFLTDSTLCSASEDCTLAIWNLNRGFRVKVLEGHTQRVTCCLQDNFSKSVLSASWDGTLRIWSLDLDHHQSLCQGVPVNTLVQHPDLALAVTGTWGGGIFVWDLTQMSQVAELRGHTGSVQALAIQDDSLISASSSGELLLWSLHSYLLVSVLAWKGPPSPTIRLLDSQSLISTGPSLLLRPLDSAESKQIGHLGTTVGGLAPLSSQVLALIHSGGTLELLNLADGKMLGKHPIQLDNAARLSFNNSPTPNTLVVTDPDGAIQVYDQQGIRTNPPKKLRQKQQVLIRGLSLDQMKSELEAARANRCPFASFVRFYIPSEPMLSDFTQESEAWSGVHRKGQMAIGCADGTVLLWKIDASDPVQLAGTKAPALSLDFKGCWLMAGCADGSVAVWSTLDGNLMALSPSDSNQTSLAFILAPEFQKGELVTLLPQIRKLTVQGGSVQVSTPFLSTGSPMKLMGTPTLDCQVQKTGTLVSIHPECQLRVSNCAAMADGSSAFREKVCCVGTDGVLVFYGDQGGKIQIRNVAEGSEPVYTQFPNCSVISGTFVHQAELLVCLCQCSPFQDHHYLQWLHLEEDGSIRHGETAALSLGRVAYCQGSEHIVGVALSGAVNLYSLTLELLTTLPYPGHWSLPLEMSSSGHVVLATERQHIITRSPSGATESWKPPALGHARITALSVLPNLAIVAGDDLGRLHFPSRVYKIHSSVAALTSRGNLLLSLGSEGIMKIWRVDSAFAIQLVGLFMVDSGFNHILLPPGFPSTTYRSSAMEARNI